MKTIDEFLAELRKELSFLHDEEASDAIEEMRSHVLDAAAANGKTPEEVIMTMASPQEIAGSYREEFGREAEAESHENAEKKPDDDARGPGGRWGQWRGPWNRACGPDFWSRFPFGAHVSSSAWREMGKRFEEYGKSMAGAFGRGCGPWGRGDWEARMRNVFDAAFPGFEWTGEPRSIELSFPVAKRVELDLRRASVSLKAGTGDALIARFKLRIGDSVAWKPAARFEGDALLIAEGLGWEGRCLEAVEIELPKGVVSVRAVSVSGDIVSAVPGVELRFITVSGDIRAEGPTESLIAQSASGDIGIETPLGDADCSTASGSIRASLQAGRHGLSLRTVSGRVDVGGQRKASSFDEKAAAGAPTFSATSASGSIRVEYR